MAQETPQIRTKTREREPLGVLPYQKSMFGGDDARPAQRKFDLFADNRVTVETEVFTMPPRPEFGRRKETK